MNRFVKIRSRHPSHNILRGKMLLPFRSVVRFGSTTEIPVQGITELNSTEAIRNSSSKLRMKTKFKENGIKTADWTTDINDIVEITEGWEFAIVAKHHFGSRGTGNYLIKSQAELDAWKVGKNITNYLFERFYNYNREYRLHVNKNGCFYTCRKMLKSDTPESKKWFKNDSNSVWIMESNESFDKPVNWETIVNECIKALNAVGLDFGAVDLRVQSSKDGKGKQRPDPDFIVVEINSAPSFGEVTAQKYLEQIPLMLKEKYELQY